MKERLKGWLDENSVFFIVRNCKKIYDNNNNDNNDDNSSTSGFLSNISDLSINSSLSGNDDVEDDEAELNRMILEFATMEMEMLVDDEEEDNNNKKQKKN